MGSFSSGRKLSQSFFKNLLTLTICLFYHGYISGFNFDGSIFKEEGMAGIGVVIRNEQGLVIASMSKKFILPHSVDEVGVSAAIKALGFAQDIGISSIILEGDSEGIIKALVSDDESFASYSHLVEEAKSLLSFVKGCLVCNCTWTCSLE